MKKSILLIIPLSTISIIHTAHMEIPASLKPSTQAASSIMQNAGSVASDIIGNLNGIQTILELVTPAIEKIRQSKIARNPKNNVATAIQQYKDYIQAKAKLGSTGGRGTSNAAVQDPEYKRTKRSLNEDELAVYEKVEVTAAQLQKMFPLMGGISSIVISFLDLAYRASTSVPPYTNIPKGAPLPQ